MAKTSMNMMAAALAAPTASSGAAASASKPKSKTPASKNAAANQDALKTTAEKPAKPAKPEGPVAIETNQQLLKALWSARGNVFVMVDGRRLAIQKSSYVEILKADLNGAATHDLISKGPAESELVLRKAK